MSACEKCNCVRYTFEYRFRGRKCRYIDEFSSVCQVRVRYQIRVGLRYRCGYRLMRAIEVTNIRGDDLEKVNDVFLSISI